MNRKPFLYIFAGVIAAGVICLVAGLIVHFTVSGSPVVTIVSLFALIAGGIMAGIGLISLLICLLIIVFSRGEKKQEAIEEVAADEVVADNSAEGEKTEEIETAQENSDEADAETDNQEEK